MSIHRSDPRERRLLLWIVLAAILLALAGAYGIWLIRDQFMLLFSVSQEEGVGMARKILRGLTLLLAAQAIGIAWYLGRRAAAVRRLQQFPLPGSRTIFNQKIRYGAEAVRLGRLGQVAAIMFGLLGLVALWIGLR